MEEMLKLFVGGFSPYRIFQQRNAKTRSFIAYFILLIFIVSFPLNLQIIRSGGWDLYNFTAGIQQSNPDWLPYQLPEDIEISRYGMYYVDEVVHTFATTNVSGDPLNIVFAPVDNYEVSGRSLVFEKESIVYYNENNTNVFTIGYSNISQTVRFSELRMMTQSEAVNVFSDMISQAFSNYAVFRSIFLYTGITLFLNVILVVVLSAIFIFIRINYQQVTSFGQNLRIVIASMTLPSIIGFIVGILEIVEFNAFSVVIFQFMTPLIALFAIYKGAKQTQAQNK